MGTYHLHAACHALRNAAILLVVEMIYISIESPPLVAKLNCCC